MIKEHLTMRFSIDLFHIEANYDYSILSVHWKDKSIIPSTYKSLPNLFVSISFEILLQKRFQTKLIKFLIPEGVDTQSCSFKKG